MGSLVYFIRAGDSGPIKIGYTEDLRGRLKSLHPHRLRGEWFAPCDEVLDVLGAISLEDAHAKFRALNEFWAAA